jgi:hypothetical protein
VEEGIGHDQLARVDAGNIGEQPVRRGYCHPEDAGGNIDPGERQLLLLASLHATEHHQVVRRGRIEQLFLGDRARRDQPDHVAPDHGFVAALLRLCRILHLLADGDAEPERDQLLEVVVGRMHGHAAHGNVFAAMLAALRQCDAERTAGRLGVFEEELVEIAHAIEQQAVRIGSLDLDILLHHGRGALGRRNWRRRRLPATHRRFVVQEAPLGKNTVAACWAIYLPQM